MIIQVQRETGLANRTIVLSERQVAFLRIVGSRIGLAAIAVFLMTWILFAAQTIRVPVLAVRIAELERDNRRIDSLQVALSRMHGRYEQVRQMLAVGGAAPRQESPASATPVLPNAKRADGATPPATAVTPDTGGTAR
jgi:hypothetical protein